MNISRDFFLGENSRVSGEVCKIDCNWLEISVWAGERGISESRVPANVRCSFVILSGPAAFFDGSE